MYICVGNRYIVYHRKICIRKNYVFEENAHYNLNKAFLIMRMCVGCVFRRI